MTTKKRKAKPKPKAKPKAKAKPKKKPTKKPKADVFEPNAELEAAIDAAPNDKSAYHAYAAWLKKHGSPFLGKLVADGAEYYPTSWDAQPLLFGSDDVVRMFQTNVTPFMGFVRTVKLLDKKDVGAVLPKLFERPISRFIGELACSSFPDFEDGTSDVVRALIAWPGAAKLRILSLASTDLESNDWDSCPSLGKLDALWPHVPNLVSLYLRGASHDAYGDDADTVLGKLRFPQLRYFMRRASDLRAAELADILAADVPQLEDFGLVLGDGAEVDARALEPVFAGRVFPGLRRLTLDRTSNTLAVLDALARSPLLPKLSRLSVAGGDLDDADARWLLDNAGAFAHLEYFGLSHNLFVDSESAVDAALPKAHTAGLRGSVDEEFYQDAIYQEAPGWDDVFGDGD